jgi:hypothetical protein
MQQIPPKSFGGALRWTRSCLCGLCSASGSRLLHVQERLIMGFLIGSQMHGCPAVSCVWSSSGCTRWVPMLVWDHILW